MVDVLSNIILLFLVSLFLKDFFESYNNPRKHFSLTEYITLQPLEKDVPINRISQQTVTKAVKKDAPSKPIVVKNKNGYTQLQQDCFDALKSVGVKTVRERKYLVNTIFNDNDPKNIQEFLQLAFKGK